nr:immunoglobulin heavy chain junction region [Mus musculus]
CATTMVTGW